jgi:hypothetical protein
MFHFVSFNFELELTCNSYSQQRTYILGDNRMVLLVAVELQLVVAEQLQAVVLLERMLLRHQ